MVGHTGVLEAAVAAVETVDSSVGRVLDAVKTMGGSAIVTADHGNAEQMVAGEDGSVFTAHTTEHVPFICIAEGVTSVRAGGILADVAPSVLDLFGMEQPAEWTGRSLLVRA
jgi:2,3-bisphosphoglycerate-independent phosphoglycerate mutase